MLLDHRCGSCKDLLLYFRYLSKLDDIFGSRDLQYKLKHGFDLDLNNPPPYFYPENIGNPYYPQNGWEATSKQPLTGGGAFPNNAIYNQQFMLNDVCCGLVVFC